MINRVTGTEDILDCSLLNFVLTTLQKKLTTAHFSHIQTPILEYTNLFVHSLGDQTDVVSKEMYTFNSDTEKSICLRPEMTASTIRACIENGIERFPWKVFSYGPLFRRERPQKGRLRQFTQFNMEIINAPSIMHDAFFISYLHTLFTDSFKFNDFIIKINFLGCSPDRLQHKTALTDFLQSNIANLCQTCVTRSTTNTLRVFDCKNSTCQSLYENAPILTHYLCTECTTEWTTLQNTLHMLNVSHTIDTKLVRGLDYYHKTVFEFCATTGLGSQNTFCGGGRYKLGGELNSNKNFDSIGAAIGIERLLLILENNTANLNLPCEEKLTVIIPMTHKQDALGLLLMQSITNNNIHCDIILEKASMTNMLKKANKMNAHFVIMLGETEMMQGTATLKNMISGSTTIVQQTELVEHLR